MSRPDRTAAASQAISRIFSEPLTWMPFLPVAAAYAFVGAPWWICTTAAGAIGTVVFAWWKRRWGSVYDNARIKNLTAYLEKENARLEAALHDVSGRIAWPRVKTLARGEEGARLDAAFVADALRQKKLLESKILSDGILTSDEEDLSAVVSDLFQNVIQELEQLAASPGGSNEAATAAVKSIADACRTIRRAGEEVEQLIDPLAGLSVPGLPPEGRSIERNTERLRERMQQAAAIKRRVAESFQPAAPPQEPQRQDEVAQ